MPSRQLHLQLFALTVTDQRQIHYFAGLGLLERFFDVVDVMGPYSINGDNKLVRFAYTARLKCRHTYYRRREEHRSQ